MLYEQDFVIAKHPSCCLSINKYKVPAIPTYNKYNQIKEPIVVGLKNTQCETLVDFNQVAAKAFSEQYPMLLLRQIARLTAKHQIESFGILGQVTNIITEQADLEAGSPCQVKFAQCTQCCQLSTIKLALMATQLLLILNHKSTL